MLNIVFERKRSMKSTIIAISYLILLAALVTFGCASECPGYYRVEEEGYIRCSATNPEAASEDWDSIRCSVVERDDAGTPVRNEDGIPFVGDTPACCVFGADFSDRECMEKQACIDRLAKIPAKTNFQTCDDSSDCELLYGNEPDPADRKIMCCAPWKEDVTECRLPENCVYSDDDGIFQNCLSTWQCTPPRECIVNVYMDDLFYCKDPADM
jgi:hypothetical protein